jgi:hypothetical protein
MPAAGSASMSTILGRAQKFAVLWRGAEITILAHFWNVFAALHSRPPLYLPSETNVTTY